MRILLLALMFAVVTPCVMPRCHADELKERQQITDTFIKLFAQQDFKRLTAISDHYIRTGARTSSGLWKITLFDLAIQTLAQRATSGPAGEAYLNGLESTAMEWIAESPTSPSAYVDYAVLLESHAMAYQKWQVQHHAQHVVNGFEDKIRLAMETLKKHKKIASLDPQYYAEIVDIARIGNLSPAIVASALNEGSKRYPYYDQLYFNTLWFLKPQLMNSDPQALRNFADFVVSKTRKKAGIGLYARLYWVVANNSFANAAFTDGKHWKKLAHAMEDVLRLYPDQWNIQHFAYFSCINGDRSETKRLIKRMHGTLISDAWANRGVFDQCRSWAYGSTP